MRDYILRLTTLPVFAAGLSAIGVLVLTSIHHLYGAFIYQTPWRHHVAVVSIPVMLVLAGALVIVRTPTHARSRRIALWVFTIVSVIVPIGWIGFFEGGYNHVLKNALYFAGASQEVLTALFPPPTYEMLNSIFFEVTEILQFPATLLAAYWTLHLCTNRSGDKHHS